MRTHVAPYRILALPGSLRRNGYNRRLLEAAARVAPAGLRVEVYCGLADIPLFDEDLEVATYGGPDSVHLLRSAVAAADGILISTPEYNQSLPGGLKNVIDWLSRPAPDELLAGKPIAITGASAGRWGTRLAQAALRQALPATESQVMPAPMLFVRDAAQLFDGDTGLCDAATLQSIQALLLAFLRWIQCLSEKSTASAA